MTAVSVVVPTIGRASLGALLSDIETAMGAATEVIVVDDRVRRDAALPFGGADPKVLATRGGAGPAAARNMGWRAAGGEWIVFLDDDVRMPADWGLHLASDLSRCGPHVGGNQGRVVVPLPPDRKPTDRERSVAGLSGATWITADMAYRRSALEDVGGFDEGFTRAYREDSDLALRVLDAGWSLVRGERHIVHPVSPAPWWISVAAQVGNRDDIRMWKRHGRGWRSRAGASRGLALSHAATTALLTASLFGRRSSRLFAALWAARTAAFAVRRIAPGPRTPAETAAMVVTSIAIPPVATFWRIAGLVTQAPPAVSAVLFDRDGTLVEDVPYCADPSLVVPFADSAPNLDRLRRRGLALGVVSNQSGVGRGLMTRGDVDAVMEHVERLVGPFDVIVYCPHTAEESCSCRKPAPGLVVEACRRLGVDPGRCVVVGDILTDIHAAEAAGARGILVPNPSTDPRDIAGARWVAPSLAAAVDLILTWS